MFEILKCIQNDQLDLLDSSNYYQLNILQRYIPILSSFLSKCYKENHSHMPFLVQQLIGDIIGCMLRVPRFQNQSCLIIYLLKKMHLSNFTSISRPQKLFCHPKSNVDECRKYPESHPVLTPGIFTIYCQHGICYIWLPSNGFP